VKWPVNRPINVYRAEIDDAMGQLAGKGYRIELEESEEEERWDRDARDLIYIARDSWNNTKDQL
jgi:hypothetical protein